MVNVLVNTAVRCFIVYLLALFLARLMGRKLISQMTFFDFIIGVSIGSIIANAIVGQKFTSISAAAALVVVSVLVILTGYLHIKSFKIRKIVNSEPVTLVDSGRIVEENMRNIRLTIDELMMKLREKNAFNLADVEFAIMETDGELSVLPKSDKKPLTPSNMNIKTSSTGITHDVIIDGNIMEENLISAGLDSKWLENQLSNQNIKAASEIFYAGVDNTKKLYISKKIRNSKEEEGRYGID